MTVKASAPALLPTAPPERCGHCSCAPQPYRAEQRSGALPAGLQNCEASVRSTPPARLSRGEQLRFTTTFHERN